MPEAIPFIVPSGLSLFWLKYVGCYQFEGFLDAINIPGPDGARLRCTWRNYIHLYGVFLFCTAGFFNYVCTAEVLKRGVKLARLGGTMFYTVVMLNILLFVRVSWNISWMSKEFDRVDKLNGPPRVLARRIKVFIISAILLACMEYGFLTILTMNKAQDLIEKEELGVGQAYYQARFPAENRYYPYSWFALLHLLPSNIIFTWNWNFLDFFLVAISMEISSRFAHIYDVLQTHRKSDASDFWRHMCFTYNQLSILTKKIDIVVSHMLLISYISNLFHLSLQLQRTLRVRGAMYEMVYFYFSLIYLILRTLSVSICVADIREQSLRPKSVLFSIQNEDAAAARFLQQVLTDDISLTGSKFFSVNRNFLIKLTGMIVTYEVILLQLNALN